MMLAELRGSFSFPLLTSSLSTVLIRYMGDQRQQAVEEKKSAQEAYDARKKEVKVCCTFEFTSYVLCCLTLLDIGQCAKTC